MFYDALGTNDSAVKLLGDEILRKIAFELTQMIRSSVTIDWTQRESVQAEIRLKVKKILRKYGYPPDREKKATETGTEASWPRCQGLGDLKFCLQAISIGMQAYSMKIDLLSSATVVERAVQFVEI